ncbi:hypothetical protein EUTSA_v100160410mg, partial [Eutrema salsugineum]
KPQIVFAWASLEDDACNNVQPHLMPSITSIIQESQ